MSYLKEIYSFKELESLIHNGIITDGFWVNSTSVNKLEGVKEIRAGEGGTVHFKNLIDIGDLEYIDCGFSFFGNLHSLNNLKYVGGEFRFGAPLKSLGQLKEVKGDFRPTTNDLEDLGQLTKVGGTVDLRGMTKIVDLSPLREIGGNLNLVKALKNQYDLNKIKVKGRIIYWNSEPKFYEEPNELVKSKFPPPWKSAGPYEFENNLLVLSKEQLDFYNHFKNSFKKGEHIDVGGMRNYIRYFIYEIRNQYYKDFDFQQLKSQYENLRKYYPSLSHDTLNIEVKIGRDLGINEYVFKVLPHEEYTNWIKEIQELVRNNPQRIESVDDKISEEDLVTILIMGFKENTLTSYGKKNIKAIQEMTVEAIREIEAKDNVSFCRKFFDAGKYFRTGKKLDGFDPSVYKDFFNSEDEFEFYLKEHNKRMIGVPTENISDPKYYPSILEFAVRQTIGSLMRKSENELRANFGLPLIGEGWISETELFYKIKSAYPNLTVLHHGRPKWLGLQHFDIYFPEFNIAIEYQGAQHYEEVEIFGGKEGFEKTRLNDQLKKEKCKMHSCTLIEVMPNYDFNHIINQIDSIIKNREI